MEFFFTRPEGLEELSLVQMLNNLPSTVQSRMQSRLDTIRKSVSLPILPRRSSAPPPYSEPASAQPSAPASVASDADSDASTSTAASSAASTHQQLEASPPAAAAERRKQQSDRPVLEARIPGGFGAASFDATNLRWSPSGIRWRYARQGAHLTGLSSQEMTDPAFERRTYIDGVAYFLRACPDNLTELETDILLRSAPWLAEKVRPQRQMALQRPSDRGKTFLHRGVQWSVFALIVAAHALWLFFMNIARVGAYCERQYNISHHLIANGSVVANAVGKHSVVLSGRITGISECRVGQMVSGFAAWTIDSFTSGIQDGFGDGIVRIGGQLPNREENLQPWTED